MAWLRFVIASYLCLSLVQGERKVYECSEKSKHGVPFCIYAVGDPTTNIIVNVPNAGHLLPTRIPDRSVGCLDSKGFTCKWNHHCGKPDFDRCRAVITRDNGVDQIASKIVAVFEEELKSRPHFVMNNLQRTKLDGDREIYEAGFKNPIASDTYNEYQNFIRQAIDSTKGRMLFIDMHASKDEEEDRVQIGYLLTTRDLNKTKANIFYSSIRGMVKNSNYSFEEILRGEKSLGSVLDGRGIEAIPSPRHPKPKNSPYFPGGNNLYIHASTWNQRVDGIHISIPPRYRYHGQRSKFARELAYAIIDWIKDLS